MRIWGMGLLNGLKITMRNMRRGPITVQYPFERWELPERSRWAIEHLRDEEGVLKCTACALCVRACPDTCIAMESTTLEDKSKTIDSYRWEMGACMFCGLCVESCPFDAIVMGHDFELATSDPTALTRTLITGEPAAGRKRAAAEGGDAS